MMNLFEGHERFARKNESLARGYQIGDRDKKMEEKGASHLQTGREPACFGCKFRFRCKDFEKMRTGGSTGAVSYGGDAARIRFICDRFEAQKKQQASMNDKEIKSLLKNAMKGRI